MNEEIIPNTNPNLVAVVSYVKNMSVDYLKHLPKDQTIQSAIEIQEIPIIAFKGYLHPEPILLINHGNILTITLLDKLTNAWWHEINSERKLFTSGNGKGELVPMLYDIANFYRNDQKTKIGDDYV